MNMMTINKSVISKATIMIVLAVGVFSLGYKPALLNEAQANPPGMQAASTGGVPYISLTGTYIGNSSSSTVLYTVPANRVLIITGTEGYSHVSGSPALNTTQWPNFDIFQDTTKKLPAGFLGRPRSDYSNGGISLGSNQARIPFAAGSQIILKPLNSGGSHEHHYFIQGYLANPG
jgi:hypothetical protein